MTKIPGFSNNRFAAEFLKAAKALKPDDPHKDNPTTGTADPMSAARATVKELFNRQPPEEEQTEAAKAKAHKLLHGENSK